MWRRYIISDIILSSWNETPIRYRVLLSKKCPCYHFWVFKNNALPKHKALLLLYEFLTVYGFKSGLSCWIYLLTGSLEMKKLRFAIMGQKGKNLDDLESMDGSVFMFTNEQWILSDNS